LSVTDYLYQGRQHRFKTGWVVGIGLTAG